MKLYKALDTDRSVLHEHTSDYPNMASFRDASMNKTGTSGTGSTLTLRTMLLKAMQTFEIHHDNAYLNNRSVAWVLRENSFGRVHYTFFPTLKERSTTSERRNRINPEVATTRPLTRYRKTAQVQVIDIFGSPTPNRQS